ncbi:MAG: DNA-3-methyladenine glycosylase 2 family protein [Candidatus Marinimicrobia bacterium]|nr:DNA-3-methyladenine glycosylase 2 family protein [Candidatus Neomarinimicrobiota bacterium]
MVFTLDPKGPFNLYIGLGDLTREPFGLTEQLKNKKYYTVLSGQLVTVTQEKHDGVLTIEIDNRDSELQQIVISELKNRFGLNQDIIQFYRFAKKDPHLAPLIETLIGLRMYQKSPFEALITAITDQQLNVAFATTLKHRLITHYGLHFTDNSELWTFPTPEKIANLPEDALRPLQYSGSKSRFIIRLAKGIMSGEYSLDHWTSLKDDELLEVLMSIYGVGKWTAEYAAMIGFNRTDLVPAADIGLQKAVQRCYHLEERPTETQVREIAENWKPWRGLVTYYLWHGFE